MTYIRALTSDTMTLPIIRSDIIIQEVSYFENSSLSSSYRKQSSSISIMYISTFIFKMHFNAFYETGEISYLCLQFLCMFPVLESWPDDDQILGSKRVAI